MTIFHVLKYPLSEPPTRKELEALPKELFENMRRTLGLTNLTPAAFGMHLDNLWIQIDDYPYRLFMMVLHRSILEYDGIE